jgi:hypothetical protein
MKAALIVAAPRWWDQLDHLAVSGEARTHAPPQHEPAACAALLDPWARLPGPAGMLGTTRIA